MTQNKNPGQRKSWTCRQNYCIVFILIYLEVHSALHFLESNRTTRLLFKDSIFITGFQVKIGQQFCLYFNDPLKDSFGVLNVSDFYQLKNVNLDNNYSCSFNILSRGLFVSWGFMRSSPGPQGKFGKILTIFQTIYLPCSLFCGTGVWYCLPLMIGWFPLPRI